MTRTIYLDHAATTPPVPAVLDAMQACALEAYGNASSIHTDGLRAARCVERARATLAACLKADPKEIVFTSGGTESNNLALKGVMGVRGGRHMITSAIEHPSVLNVCDWLESLGHAVTRLPVDGEGRVDPADVRRALRPDTALVSIIHGSNEMGTLQPLADIGAVCREAGVHFHVDACQTFTRAPIDVAAMGLDLVSVNAHKVHGPKGVGALFIREGVTVEPLLLGGGHESGRRAGTSNTPGIVGFGVAATLARDDEVARMVGLRDALIEAVLARVEGAHLTGPRHDRLCSIASFVFEGLSGKKLQRALSLRGITVSAGSACRSGSLAPSHVLLAMGVDETLAHGALRLSVGLTSTEEDISPAVDALVEAVAELRTASREALACGGRSGGGEASDA